MNPPPVDNFWRCLCGFLLGLALFLTLGSTGSTWAAPATPAAPCPGFRGWCWGATPQQMQGLMLVARGQEGQPLEMFSLPGDDTSLGGARVDRIFYAFWRGRLASVRAEFHGADNVAGLKAFLVERYGPAQQPNQFRQRYLFNNGPSIGTLEYNDIRDKGFLLISSQEMARQAASASQHP